MQSVLNAVKLSCNFVGLTMEFREVFVSAPVTAIEVQKNHLLSGEASTLHVYSLTTGQHLTQHCLLGPHIIHGIRKGGNGLYAVFGQKAVSVAQIEHGENVKLSILCGTTEFPDWILDVALLGNDASPSPATCLGLVLAHNSAMLWDWKQKACLEHVHCAENCILYSARLLGRSWSELTIAAGTVFNQVVLWKPMGPRDAGGRVPVQRRLSGHEGVIFNLSYHEGRRLLCSVSDDRSIRLWHLDLKNTPEEQSGTVHLTMYGHSARVWDAKILDHSIVSVGEDATCCVWNNSGEIVCRFTGHKGRSIWSLAVHENQKLIATGGGDGSIRIWPLDSSQEERIATEELHIQTDAPPDLLNASASTGTTAPCASGMLSDVEGFNPRQLAVLNSGKIIVLTLNGYLLCYTLGSRRWELLSHDPNYQSYCLLSVCPNHRAAALGNIQGSLKIVALDNGRTMLKMEVFIGKVFSLCWEKEDNLFVSGPDGVVVWVEVKQSTGAYSPEKLARFQLPQAPQRWLTTTALVPHEQSALVCGDRRGSLLLYTRLCETKQEGEPVGPTHSVPGIHGKAGVTQVCHHAGCIYSTGRDGTYRQYRIQGTRLQILNTFKVYKGFNWIENISFTAADDILVTGFHASSFIVWSPRSNEKLVQIQCGGGHRAWGFATCRLPPTPGDAVPTGGDCSPTQGDAVASRDGTGGTQAVFACIKAKKIIVCTAPGEKLQQHPIIKESLHGRRITCIKHLATVALPKGECAVCATGSEDNAVNIVALMFPFGKSASIHVLHRLQVHISSVRCLTVCPASSTAMSSEEGEQAEVTEGQERGQKLLLFSVGGRRAIQCWRVGIPANCPIQDQAPEWLKSTCSVEHLASYGNTDNVKQRRWLKKHGRTINPETRFMSVSAWRGSKLIGCHRSQCILGLAGSDACLRLFLFDEGTNRLSPFLLSNSEGSCLLTTLSMTHAFPWGPSPILLTAGTDGRIAFWDIQKALQECGAKGLDCIDEDDFAQHEQTEDCEVELKIDEHSCESSKIITDDTQESHSNAQSCGETSKPYTSTTEPQSNTKELNSMYKEPCNTTVEPCTEAKEPCRNMKEPSSSSQEQCSASGEPCSTTIELCSDAEESRNMKEPFGNAEEPSSTTREPFSDTQELHSNLRSSNISPISHVKTNPDMGRTELSQLARTARKHGLAEADASWDSEGILGRSSLLSLTAHQSGINALCISQIDSCRYLVASGGDDNSVQLSLISVSCTDSASPLSLRLEHTHCITSAHAAQVTGLSFIDAFTLASSSIDQRLNVWTISLSSDKTSFLKVELLASGFTLIADSAGMAHWPLRHGGHAIAVCGQGLQVLHLRESLGTRPETSNVP